jgi:hypothetical protein
VLQKPQVRYDWGGVNAQGILIISFHLGTMKYAENTAKMLYDHLEPNFGATPDNACFFFFFLLEKINQ